MSSVTITHLFEYAAGKGGSFDYDVSLGHGIVSHVGRSNDGFQPDILGLFREYYQAALGWCTHLRRDIGLWYLDGRDDEAPQCWRSWQLTWTASRGGIVGAVAALAAHLTAGTPAEQIAALAFLSDVADYVVHREPAYFGGGRLPPRLDPEDPVRNLVETPVRLGVSAPISVRPGQSFVARLVAYRGGDEAKAEHLLRGSRHRAQPALDVAKTCRWPAGTRVAVTLSGEHIEVLKPKQEFVWENETDVSVFDVKVTEVVPEIVLGFDVSANGVPVAEPRLEIDVTTDASLLTAKQPDVAEEPPFRIGQGVTATSAFASYASTDRARVMDGVNTMSSLGIDVFCDCLDLQQGEEWKSRLENELHKRDLFMLCWSRAARDSPWVAWELETVLDHRGEEPVRVNPLEPHVAPPERLPHLHFGGPGVWVRAAVVGTPAIQ